MATLTATNQRVQYYLTYSTNGPSTAAKCKRMEALKATLEGRNVMLDELFPNKQLAVLDHILYITSGAGIAKVGADRLAERCEVSVRTVMSAVKALKQTGEFIVARLIKTQGGVGKYIFIDKKHADFKEIMREVFSLSDYQIAELNAEQFAEQKKTESVEAVSTKGEKQGSNINIFFSSLKQVKNNYINDIESIQKEIEEQPLNNRKELAVYASNSFQMAFYDFLTLCDYNSSINDVKGILALRIGSDCDAKRFVKAKNIIHSIAMQMNNGHTFDNIVATFTGALSKAEHYNVQSNGYKKPSTTRKVAFYDWLKERE